MSVSNKETKKQRKKQRNKETNKTKTQKLYNKTTSKIPNPNRRPKKTKRFKEASPDSSAGSYLREDRCYEWIFATNAEEREHPTITV